MAYPLLFMVARVVYGSPQQPNNINVLWYDLSAPPAEPQAFADLAADAIAGAVALPLKGCLTTLSLFRGVEISLSVGATAYTSSSVSGAGVGEVVGDELPSYAAVCIQKRTAEGGRSGRGRWYVGAVPESLTDEGRLTVGGATAYQNLALAFNSAPEVAAGTDLIPHHFSKKNNTSYPITSVLTQNVLATQRRRRLRPGLGV